MITVKKLSMVIAGAALSAFCLGLEVAQAHPGHSPLEPHEEGLSSSTSVVGGQDVLVVPPDAPGRPAYYATGNLYTFLATGEETGGAFSLFDFVVPPQSGALPHIHSREDELFYVLEGEVTFQLESQTGIQTTVGTPGTFAFLPKGRPHAWENSGTTPAKMLSLVVPSGIEGFFVEQNQPVIDESAPIPSPLPVSVIAPISASYGIAPASPSDFSESNTQEGLLDYLVVSPDTDRPSFNEAGGLYTSLATEEETGGQFELLDVLLQPQAGSGLLQSNDQKAQSFYVLDGEVTIQLEDQSLLGPSGTFVYLPEGTPYAFQNLGTTEARTLLLSTSTPVPEPSSLLGVLGFGAFFGANLVLKRKQKKQKSANLDTSTDTGRLTNK